MLIHDRKEAGYRLARKLQKKDLEIDELVGLASGGVVVGREMSRQLGRDIHMMAVEAIGAPDSPDVKIGAVTYDGTLALKDGAIDELGVSPSYIEQARITAKREALHFFRLYSPQPERKSFAGKNVVVVDDGSSTDSEIIAAIGHVKKRGATSVVVAVPVLEKEEKDRLGEVADGVCTLETTVDRGDISDVYMSYDWITESDLKRYING